MAALPEILPAVRTTPASDGRIRGRIRRAISWVFVGDQPAVTLPASPWWIGEAQRESRRHQFIQLFLDRTAL